MHFFLRVLSYMVRLILINFTIFAGRSYVRGCISSSITTCIWYDHDCLLSFLYFVLHLGSHELITDDLEHCKDPRPLLFSYHHGNSVSFLLPKKQTLALYFPYFLMVWLYCLRHPDLEYLCRNDLVATYLTLFGIQWLLRVQVLLYGA